MRINQNPEQKARDKIDQMLVQAGWVVQGKTRINLGAAVGIAIREYQTLEAGFADYALFVNRKAVGVIEAKREEEGERITTVEEQSARYATATLKYVNNDEPLRFQFGSTGVITRMTDTLDPKPRSREIFSFPRPETIAEWMGQARSLRGRLVEALPLLNPTNLPAQAMGLRACQLEAITNLEQSFRENRPRALVHMTMGAGKTYTAITTIYRLLKYAGAKRILFLVDTKNLGEQAEQEMMAYVPMDDNRQLTELYNVRRLSSPYIADDSQVVISTIQRLYSILQDKSLDDAAEEVNPYELVQPKEPMPVVYNEKVPPEFFDFIVIDECHRSIYNVWQQVLDYFDAYLIGLTATPSNRTYGFFERNVVSEYGHEQAVIDGVNVPGEQFVIETEITKNGSELKKAEWYTRREKQTRSRRWEAQEETEAYSGKRLDRSVVAPDQIRTVISTFRAKLPELFPGRKEVPKTLIFAKTDSHADDIIQMVRKVFGESSDFCKKVTYKSKEDPKSVLAQFRQAYYPRIAVTVDMIATGTDVKPLECLIFMRDVRSKNYFDQMLGRGTRTLDEDGLTKVSQSARGPKTHFVIVDAVGVLASIKTRSIQPLNPKRSVPFKDLAMGVMMGARDGDTVSSLGARLNRIEKQLDEKQAAAVEAVLGMPLRTLVGRLFGAIDPDAVEARAIENGDAEPTEAQLENAQAELIDLVAPILTGEAIDVIDEIRRQNEQTIDALSLDKVIRAEWVDDTAAKDTALIAEFEAFFAVHEDELTALTIYFKEPYRRRELTHGMIADVLEKLQTEKPMLVPARVWAAYARLDGYTGDDPVTKLTMLVGLLRRVSGVDKTLTTFEGTVRNNFQAWVMGKHAGTTEKFSTAQMDWLRMLRDHVVTSFHIERDDLGYAPFDAHGGIGQMYQLFGDGMDALMDELNEALVA